ncbi:hypothetical protein LHYA1_G003138 [Lachnellula hyalina]|uniref:Uncharacterized protein n=1 Tax=Lachnellula hyalina TaxID=1316788 RepID=A0A8H8R3Q6_9HELO|nr:uncharacterized protein LHYA1_G003138 [Lachnellula hyalina]TVY27096.1 hypothetical protein LHYA1_G003138 [Lachnellula hyalina]
MFDLPDAKRVRRSDLYARSQSSSPTPSEPDPDFEAQLQARLASLYGSAFGASTTTSISNPSAAPNGKIQPDAEAEDEPAEFEFRLFSSGKNDEAKPQKIVLEDEEEELGEGRFVRNRDLAYYFAEKAVGEQKWKFESAALSGEEILDLAKQRAWGLEVPWRVTVLKTSVKSKTAGGAVDKMVMAGRKRPGKKSRIILRQKKKKRDEIEENERRDKELKDETEREKRTRRNREKKVKKKMKEKAKKAEGAGIEVAGGSVASSGDD